MGARHRLRVAGWSFWVPVVVSAIAVAATFLSLVQPQWIERFFGASPDGGSGESEWWITAIAAAVAGASLLVTRWQWRRVQAA